MLENLSLQSCESVENHPSVIKYTIRPARTLIYCH